MPLGISFEIAIGIPSEVTEGIYPGNPLEVSIEFTYVIPSGIPVGFCPVIVRVFFFSGIDLEIPPEIPSWFSPMI